jgi:hypothetical protein
MNKKIYIGASVFILIAIMSLVFMKLQKIPVSAPLASLTNNNQDSGEAISVLPAGAFGSLASLSGAIAVGESARLSSAPTAMGTMGIARNMMAADVSVSSTVTSPAIAPMPPIDAKMMMPFYGFKYVYKGDALELKEETSAVYRRLKGSGLAAKDLAAALGSFGFSDLSLSTFNNLKMTNFSMVEDKVQGLMINFDFNEDNIYISENWEQWKYVERDNCGSDQACWERYRMKMSDVPADEDLIIMSDKFLSAHKVNLEHYGQAVVDNYWRENYNITEDKNNFYIPEYATVIYPLLIDGQAVRDQSGSYAGLRVTINLIKKAASGLNGLTPYRYEASNYALETSAETIVKLAENGGWNRNYYMQSENLTTIELGTPERTYVQIWKYENNRNDELLVPALIFPVINSSTTLNYYGQKYIIVPLVKDMIQDLGSQPMPYLMMKDGSGVSGGSAGSAGSVDSTEPAVGAAEIMPVPTPAILR